MSAPIIIKRKKVVAGDGHHGGAWKVAYADFVTAMMAFFLLMWLLNATTEDQRKGIADYFDPTIPVSRISGGGDDVLAGDSVFSEDAKVKDGTGGSGGVRGPASAPTRGPETERPDGFPDADSAADNDRIAEEIMKSAAAAGADGELSSHLIMRQTPEGLVIEIVDQADRPLFPVGSAAASDKLQQLLTIVAEVTARVTNEIAIVGHTDALSYGEGARYTNWELSSDRALEARRSMIAAGATPDKIVEVAGKASAEPLLPDPYAPQNRRISVTLLRIDRP